MTAGFVETVKGVSPKARQLAQETRARHSPLRSCRPSIAGAQVERG